MLYFGKKANTLTVDEIYGEIMMDIDLLLTNYQNWSYKLGPLVSFFVLCNVHPGMNFLSKI